MDDVGVVAAGRDEDTLGDLGRWVTKTFGLNAAKPLLPLGYYANVLPLTPELGLAISTDGVGTKILIAQEMGRYDTVGIDCVAMNANDVICVGARPISMVDYIAVQKADPAFLGQLAKGLYAGAEMAGINIPGRRDRAGARDDPRRRATASGSTWSEPASARWRSTAS